MVKKLESYDSRVGDGSKTFCYNQSGFKIIKTGKRLDLLHLSKIGDIPIRVHRQVEGKIKQVIIKRHNSGRWFAILSVENRDKMRRSTLRRLSA